jgi:hypothetical protein
MEHKNVIGDGTIMKDRDYMPVGPTPRLTLDDPVAATLGLHSVDN